MKTPTEVLAQARDTLHICTFLFVVFVALTIYYWWTLPSTPSTWHMVVAFLWTLFAFVSGGLAIYSIIVFYRVKEIITSIRNFGMEDDDFLDL